MAATENDELEQIMSEIEELQKELSPVEPTAPVVAAAPTPPQMPAAADTPAAVFENSAEVEEDILSEIQAGATGASSDAGLEDTLAEIKAEATEGGVLDEVVNEEEIMPKEEQGSDGTLSLTLTGNMTLKLKYEFEGQDVIISFADQALCVKMSDGTEFKVPVARLTASSSESNVRPFKKAV